MSYDDLVGGRGVHVSQVRFANGTIAYFPTDQVELAAAIMKGRLDVVARTSSLPRDAGKPVLPRTERKRDDNQSRL